MEKIRLCKLNTGEYRFDLVANNRAVIASSELYSKKSAALCAIARVKKHSNHQYRINIFCGPDDKYYFELESDDDLLVSSTQGYSSIAAATEATKVLQQIALNARLIEADK